MAKQFRTHEWIFILLLQSIALFNQSSSNYVYDVTKIAFVSLSHVHAVVLKSSLTKSTNDFKEYSPTLLSNPDDADRGDVWLRNKRLEDTFIHQTLSTGAVYYDHPFSSKALPYNHTPTNRDYDLASTNGNIGYSRTPTNRTRDHDQAPSTGNTAYGHTQHTDTKANELAPTSETLSVYIHKLVNRTTAYDHASTRRTEISNTRSPTNRTNTSYHHVPTNGTTANAHNKVADDNGMTSQSPRMTTNTSPCGTESVLSSRTASMHALEATSSRILSNKTSSLSTDDIRQCLSTKGTLTVNASRGHITYRKLGTDTFPDGSILLFVTCRIFLVFPREKVIRMTIHQLPSLCDTRFSLYIDNGRASSFVWGKLRKFNCYSSGNLQILSTENIVTIEMSVYKTSQTSLFHMSFEEGETLSLSIVFLTGTSGKLGCCCRAYGLFRVVHVHLLLSLWHRPWL
ncbi:hypothetical protein BaRGS_00005607 [Batillaria attramentaria]|uniref:Uncharacterized protein n=1 Tax=Batillaria attramentaria TaxID=370345 RepID=A0ABD0LV63_9CAEN